MAEYVQRSLIPPKESYFLLGPRGTGKSTWLLHHYPHATRIDLLLGEEERRFSAFPERIRDVVESLPPGSTLILDEVQHVPRLLPEIHALIEAKKASNISSWEAAPESCVKPSAIFWVEERFFDKWAPFLPLN